ncbi:MAG: hypothetical protein R3266_05345 [Gemmatimonadota bacterium]|nr:hypothetical protein [Gemmatimonadota bacterium]
MELNGWIERSRTVDVEAFRDGDRLATGNYEVAAEPSSRATVVGDASVRFEETGAVIITVSHDGDEVSESVQVAVPPTIVYELLRDGNRDIWKAALDGRDRERLTSDPGDDRDPTLTGDDVVFVSFRAGNGDLYRVSLSGGTVSRLTQTPADEGNPALSPAGDRLAFTADGTGVPKLWTAAADGSGAARASTESRFSGAVESSPSWAPGDDELVFMSTDAGSADLYAYREGTPGVEEVLVAGATAEVEPAWGPDGDRVVFASQRDGATDLYLLDRATGSTTRLTDRADADGQPSWLSDGRIVFTAWVDGEPRLRWLDPDDPGLEAHEIDVGSGRPGHPAGGS